MTFVDLKALIMSRVRIREICPGWQALATATTQAELLTAATGIIEWVYNTGIVPDELLPEFDTVALNAAGIYTGSNADFAATGTPPMLYFIGPGTSSIHLDGLDNKKVSVIGSHVLSIQLNDYAFLELRTGNNSVTTIAVNDSASLCAEMVGSSATNVTNYSVAQIQVAEYGQLNYTGADVSNAIITARNESQVSPTLATNATADIQIFNNAKINQPPA